MERYEICKDCAHFKAGVNMVASTITNVCTLKLDEHGCEFVLPKQGSDEGFSFWSFYKESLYENNQVPEIRVDSSAFKFPKECPSKLEFCVLYGEDL